MTLSELAELSGLPIATTHRLVSELTTWGALERTQEGAYQIGLRLWYVGALAPAHRDLRSVAVPVMEDLYEATHENVQLVVRAGTRALVLDKISGNHSVDTLTEVAGQLPLHATGVGKVILAFSDPELLAQVAAGGLPPLTPRTITLPGVLARTVSQVREAGVGYSMEEMSAGASSVAAPVFGEDGILVAALALVTRSSTDVRALAAGVRTAAIAITRQLRTPTVMN